MRTLHVSVTDKIATNSLILQCNLFIIEVI